MWDGTGRDGRRHGDAPRAAPTGGLLPAFQAEAATAVDDAADPPPVPRARTVDVPRVPGPAHEPEDQRAEAPPASDVDRVAVVDGPDDPRPVRRARPPPLLPVHLHGPPHQCTKVPRDAPGRLGHVGASDAPMDLIARRSAHAAPLDAPASTRRIARRADEALDHATRDGADAPSPLLRPACTGLWAVLWTPAEGGGAGAGGKGLSRDPGLTPRSRPRLGQEPRPAHRCESPRSALTWTGRGRDATVALPRGGPSQPDLSPATVNSGSVMQGLGRERAGPNFSGEGTSISLVGLAHSNRQARLARALTKVHLSIKRRPGGHRISIFGLGALILQPLNME